MGKNWLTEKGRGKGRKEKSRGASYSKSCSRVNFRTSAGNIFINYINIWSWRALEIWRWRDIPDMEGDYHILKPFWLWRVDKWEEMFDENRMWRSGTSGLMRNFFPKGDDRWLRRRELLGVIGDHRVTMNRPWDEAMKKGYILIA